MCTDHDKLKRILNITDTIGQMVSSGTRLSEFDINVVHSADIKHQEADVLLRLKTFGTEQTPIEDEIPILHFTASISSRNER